MVSDSAIANTQVCGLNSIVRDLLNCVNRAEALSYVELLYVTGMACGQENDY